MPKHYDDMGFAKVDTDRNRRQGFFEVVYGEGKTPEQAASIFQLLSEKNNVALCTRCDEAHAQAIIELTPKATYHKLARLVIFDEREIERKGNVIIATAGTSDIPVAEEAALSLEVFGSKATRLYDVGVAGVHRLLENVDLLKGANVIVAVAGMEGALPTVVAGLVDVPVIAVPTSVGYGASFGGISALLAMLNSCANGVSVVNIDNGFGAANQAHLINMLSVNGSRA